MGSTAMTLFSRTIVKRAREHMLYVLRSQQELCYVRSDDDWCEALVSAAGVDAAWYWPETLIHQAAEQLRCAGIVETALVRVSTDDPEPAFRITVTAKGKAFLESGKSFRCRRTNASRQVRASRLHPKRVLQCPER